MYEQGMIVQAGTPCQRGLREEGLSKESKESSGSTAMGEHPSSSFGEAVAAVLVVQRAEHGI